MIPRVDTRDLAGKSGLRFGGNVLAWKSPEILEAERTARTEGAAPDAAAARANADKRARKGRDKAPSADA